MRKYEVLFMDGNYWIIFCDDHDHNWYLQNSTRSTDRADMVLLAEALNAQQKGA